jgi:hypothetical protein
MGGRAPAYVVVLGDAMGRGQVPATACSRQHHRTIHETREAADVLATVAVFMPVSLLSWQGRIEETRLFTLSAEDVCVR